MFTGIIETLGVVRSVEGGVLLLDVQTEAWPDPIKMGESIAVNGVCLTVVDFGNGLRFDVSPETFARTSLGQLRLGSKVNLERAMRADGRFGGHIVQGHVDATGEVVSMTPSDNSVIVRFRIPDEGASFLIDKGSITLDGISLTVVEPQGTEFDTWIIPHTLQETNLGTRKPGDKVNVEYDALAKYVQRLLRVNA